MNNEISKSVIRIIQDFCFKNSASIYAQEFALSISSKVVTSINNGNISKQVFYNIAKKRQDFFIANNIDNKTLFCSNLYKTLKYELGFCIYDSFYEYIVEFKRKMENGLAKGFPDDKTSEDTLRCCLAMYIKDETFLEARMSSGLSDICIPSQKVIIETKLWKGQEYYNSGIPELNDYLDKQNYNEGYYVIFDYNKNDNIIIQKNTCLFNIDYNNKKIYVIFIRMNSTRPSKIYKNKNNK